MRDIRFRAWDKERREMRRSHNLMLDTLDGLLYWKFGYDEPMPFIRDEYVLMQFTGLTDSKGVHIWEGDVLGLIEPEVDGKQNHFGRVQVLFGEYDDSEIEYGSPAIGWYVEGYHGYKRINGSRDKYEIGGHDSHWSLLRCTTHREKWEVLGNVWEHPHLLNGEVKNA